MKRLELIIRKAVALLVVPVMLLTGCEGGSADTETVKMSQLDDWQSYTVMRSDTADEDTVKAALAIVNGIEASTGIRPQIGTDWVKRGEAAPEGTKEILIGATNRPESDCSLSYNDFTVRLDGCRVVINGGSPEALAKAADWFIENCVGKEIRVPDEAYNFEAEYPYSAIRLGGIPLSEFAVYDGADYAGEAESLMYLLADKTGVLRKKSENKILLTTDSTLGILDVSAKLDNGQLTLAVSENGNINDAVELFLSCMDGRNGDDINIDERYTKEMSNIKMLTEAQTAEWRKETDDRISEILATPNMQLPAGAKVYYVSPSGDDANDGSAPDKAWKTIDKVSTAVLASGSYVCFERGGLWRGNLKAQTGVTYTAYGAGSKPILYGSPYDGADAKLWTKTDADNIWSTPIGQKDVGTIVFNNGEAHAIKCIIRTEADGTTFNNTTGEPFKDYHDLTTDLHFYHDFKDSGILYLYSETNPGERFDSVEFNVKGNIISIGGSNITIDNLCIKYGGAHGVGAGTTLNLTVQNCEFGWIGGSIQAEGIYGRNYATRYGNAVEIYGGCDGYDVSGNYIYQVYDAGITQQYTLSEKDLANGVDRSQKNMTYCRNVIEYCNYSIEYFLGLGDYPENPSRMENFLIEDNLMWYAGRGLCEQRPDKSQACHIKGWSGGNRNRATNYVIRNNLMFDTSGAMVQITSPLYNPDGSGSMPTFENNNFVGNTGIKFGSVSQTDTSNKPYGTQIPDYLGDKSKDDIFWFEQ